MLLIWMGREPSLPRRATVPWTSGLMRLDKRRELLDRCHALIEHDEQGAHRPACAHDFQTESCKAKTRDAKLRFARISFDAIMIAGLRSFVVV